MDAIKFPIKFDSSGISKLTDGSDEYYSQLLTIAVLTEPQTLPFSPKFGVYDQSFRGLDKGLFLLNAARFVPEVQIIDLNTNLDSDGTVNATFSFIVKDRR